MDLMQIRRGLMAQMASGDKVYYSKYDLTGDTTIAQLLSRVNYHVHYENCLIMIRANGTVAPSSGSYTMNNYFVIFKNGTLVEGRHYYKNGKVAPNSIYVLLLNEEENAISIQNGVLLSSNTASTSCLGTTGDNVVIAEIPFDYDKNIGNA